MNVVNCVEMERGGFWGCADIVYYENDIIHVNYMKQRIGSNECLVKIEACDEAIDNSYYIYVYVYSAYLSIKQRTRLIKLFYLLA